MDRNDLIPSVAARIASIDAAQLAASLDERGYATLPALLNAGECRALAALYDDEAPFRSRVVMQRHGFGRGEYKYLRYPLPAPVEGLRRALYPLLAPIANRWRGALGEKGRFPGSLGDFLAECHAAGQTRPTPLILKYAADDYNRLHQDLYGALVFPLQLTILLSDPADFAGGEFLLVEQRPRMQSRGEVVPLRQGDAVVFAVHHRPVRGTRGFYRVTLRHGVSRLRSGHRFTLGVIFHDAA
jgi:hypothetical protein